MEALRPEDPKAVAGYRLEARLGSGGMGEVFLGRSPGGLAVAIKVVHRGLAATPDFRARFRREVTAARAVSGAFTAAVVDADPGAERPWLATAYLPGRSLYDVILEHGPLPVPSVYALGAGLAEALVSIHRAGVVHRDLKPSNVMLAPDGPRVIDFGIARAADASVVTQAGSVLGSPGFMPPEQAVGGEVGPPGDVFALGAVLTFAATGTGPYGTAAVTVLLYRVVHEPPDVAAIPDTGLREIAAACMDRDPARRPVPADVLRRLTVPGPRGTAWLPPAVAAEVAAGPTLPLAPRRVARRALLAGGAAAGVAGIAGAGGLAARLTRGTGGGRAPRAGTVTPLTATSPSAVPPGREVWHLNTGDTYLDSGLTLAGGTLYLGSEKGILWAVDPVKGRARWRYPTGSRINGAPAVAGGLVVAASQDEYTYALHASSGRLAWRAHAGYSPEAAPAVAGGLVFVRSADGVLHALDLATGAERWTHPADGDAVAGPGTVYATRDRGLQAVDAAHGGTRWTFTADRPVTGAAVSGGTAYCATKEAAGGPYAVYGVDAATGARRWSFAVPAAAGTPVAAGGTVYFTAGANLYALDAVKGSLRWRFGARAQGNLGAVALSGGLVYVAEGLPDPNGAVHAVDAASGAIRWTYSAVGMEYSALAAGGGTVFAAGYKDGDVYGLKGT